MDPSFQQWLVSRNVPPKLLKILQKEDVTSDTTLKAMNDSDLESLKKKHKVPTGQIVLLRSARDELKKEGAQASSKGYEHSFEVLASPPEASPVEREVSQGDTVALLPPDPAHHSPKREQCRLTRDEIREKYRLPVRSSKLRPQHNAASAVSSSSGSTTPSPLPEHLHAHSPSPGAGGGLQAASQMRDLYRKGQERGEKIAALEKKSHGLMAGAMDYEWQCAQLAEKTKTTKKQKKSKSSTLHPQEPVLDNTQRTATYPQQQYNQRLSTSAHTPSQLHHSSKSPSHTTSSHYPPGSHSVPIRQSPHHAVSTYGTMTKERLRPSSPPSLVYNADDETVPLHNDEEEPSQEQRTNDRGKWLCCCCCRTK